MTRVLYSIIVSTLVACSPRPHTSTPSSDATTPPDAFSEPPATPSPAVATEAPTPSGDVSPSVTMVDIPEVPSPVLVMPAQPSPMPLIIGAHGAGGSPEWDCDWLASVLPVPAVLLCLRGIPMGRDGNSFYYPEHHSLGRWLAASHAHVTQVHAPRLSSTSVYVGYSQGATMGALALQTAQSPIANLLLIEGGVEGWTTQRSRTFAQAGGRRVYFACGTQSCHTKAKVAAVRLKEANVDVQVHHAEGAGHTPLGEVSDLVSSGLVWLLAQPSAATD